MFHDAATGRWLLFDRPRHVVVAPTLSDVLPALDRIETLVNRDGLYAAGFLAYEAAPAFDPALRTHPGDGFPLLWFGLYPDPAREDALPGPVCPAPASILPWHPSVDRQGYDAAIARLRLYLRQGDTYQVNYSFRLRAPFSVDPQDFFRSLVHGQQAHHAAYVETDRLAICSASPELFFALNGEAIESRPMKGTARRGRTTGEDRLAAACLAQSEKDRAENVMIVDMIRNDLGRIALPGSVRPHSMFTLERYPTVWQMTSTVTARTRATFREILTALFPCASITGAPKPRTMAIIAELETSPRRIYTGTMGYLAPGRQAVFNVAIRTVCVDKTAGQAEYGVGGGIVWDSTADSEYEECRTKARLLTETRVEPTLLETLLWIPADGFFLLDRHLHRLADSAGYFGIPFARPRIEAQLRHWAGQAPAEPQRVRLLVDSKGNLTVQSHPLPAPPSRPVRVRLAPTPIDPSDVFLYHKTTQRGVYERAAATAPDCEDVLLWNPAGELTESTIANLVAETDDGLVTPPVSCGLLPGTYRAMLLEEGRIAEKPLRVDALRTFRRLYLINSVRKWREAVLA